MDIDKPIYSYCNDICKACPFNLTEESENAINLGCLPDISDIIQIKRETGLNWGCHQDSFKICAGFVAYCASYDIDYKSSNILDAPHYLNTGEYKIITQ